MEVCAMMAPISTPTPVYPQMEQNLADKEQ